MKHIITLTLLAWSFAATAVDYAIVAEDSKGNRLLGVIGSIDVGKTKDNIPYVGGTFLWSHAQTTRYVGVVDARGCLKGEGTLVMGPIGSDETSQYYWTSSGGRVYDAVGRTLCGALEAIMKRDQPKSQPNNNNRL